MSPLLVTFTVTLFLSGLIRQEVIDDSTFGPCVSASAASAVSSVLANEANTPVKHKSTVISMPAAPFRINLLSIPVPSVMSDYMYPTMIPNCPTICNNVFITEF